MLLAPAFLLGLFAIGVPLWLHRVARADPARQPFASLMLLEASDSERTARHTLRYWLLLIVRVLLLCVLVLAFAQPLLRKQLAAPGSTAGHLHAIVLDASLSMQHGDHWRRALRKADELLAGMRAPDRIMLVAASGSGGRAVQVLSEPVPAAEAGSLRPMLKELRPGSQRLDYGALMSTAEAWLGSPRPPAVLHLITDLQRSAAPLRFAELEPPPKTQLLVHDIGAADARNVYVERLALISGARPSLEVGVRSTGEQPEHRELVLKIDGQERARKGVEIAAAQTGAPQRSSGEGGPVAGSADSYPSLDSHADTLNEQPSDEAAHPATSLRAPPAPQDPAAVARILFPDLDLGPGAHRIEVELQPADALAQDDRRYAVVEQVEPKALLLAAQADSDEAAYLAAAAGSLTSPRLAVEQHAPVELQGERLRDDLHEYSMLIVTDAASLSSEIAARIRRYVAAGGTMLATLGASAADRAPLLEGWRIGEMRERAARIAVVTSTHPLLREANDWHRVRFFRQRSVQLSEGDRVLIGLEGGAPLLIERTLGAGRMLILTAPLDRTWNDLAIHPLFVRFVAEAARYLIGPDAAATSATIGTPVMTGLTAAAGGQIFDPQGERVLDLDAGSVDRLVPDRAGFYEIHGSQGTRWLAVNVDTRESDLARLSEEFVQRWQVLRLHATRAEASRLAQGDASRRASDDAGRAGTRLQAHDASPEQGQAARDRSTASASGQALGPVLLWLFAALLIAELLLANRHLTVRREMPR